MPKTPKTVGEFINILSKYNQDLPVQVELVKNGTHVSGAIDDVYKGEDIMDDEETVFIRFED